MEACDKSSVDCSLDSFELVAGGRSPGDTMQALIVLS